MKYVIVGNTGVGKTSMLNTLTNNNDESLATVGVSLYQYKCKYNDKDINLNLWDTAGQERYNSLSRSYYRNAVCIIFVFDLTDTKSFDDLVFWFEKVKNEHTDCHFIVIGNKNDNDNNRKIDYNSARTFANEHKADYFEISKYEKNMIKKIINDSIKKSVVYYEESIRFIKIPSRSIVAEKKYCEC
jgi:small GTP-binding protein